MLLFDSHIAPAYHHFKKQQQDNAFDIVISDKSNKKEPAHDIQDDSFDSDSSTSSSTPLSHSPNHPLNNGRS